MKVSDFVGTWTITSAHETEGEAFFPEDFDDKTDENIDFLEWLNETPTLTKTRGDEVTGVTLIITEGGDFTETAEENTSLPCFDEEGVMEMTATPFDGELVEMNGAFFLRPKDLDEWVSPDDDRYEVVVRYDDGDTIVCDHIELQGDVLYRTVSVSTDLIYFNRIFYTYERA